MKPSNYSHFVEIARQRAVEHPERDCIIFLEDGENKAVGDGTSAAMTYQQNDQAACQVAASLQKRGIKQGERVLVILPTVWNSSKSFMVVCTAESSRFHCQNLQDRKIWRLIWKFFYPH